MNSHPKAFKSTLYRETRDWDADIKVDIDDHKNPLRWRNVRLAAEWIKRREYVVSKVCGYRTGRGLHIRVWFVGGASDVDFGCWLPPYTVLRIQNLFGDDPIRAAFNLRRVRRKEHGWNVLWCEKLKNGKLVSRETLDRDFTKKLERILMS